MKRISIGSRVSYKSLVSDKVYYGILREISKDGTLTLVENGKDRSQIRYSRLRFIPNVFAGGKS